MQTTIETQRSKALSLYGELRRLKPEDARRALESDAAETTDAYLQKFEIAMQQSGWAESTTRQFSWHLRSIAKAAGVVFVARPRRERPPRATEHPALEGLTLAAPTLRRAAAVAGSVEGLLSEALEFYAAQFRGTPKQTILTAARELARLGTA